jgi:hypothetical protein
MALATHTVGINAAFLQEIKDDHHELRQLMHHTMAMLERPSWMQTEHDRLVELLNKLRDQLAMHFSLEEAYGYFEDAISMAPHLCRQAEQLRAQHSQLYSDICRMAERAELMLYQEPDPTVLAILAADYRDFSDRFQEHESRESQLIVEAFNNDIGTGD